MDMTFRQFLNEKEKLVDFGFGTGHSPGSLVKVVNPARPGKLVYSGLSVNKIMPVPRCGKLKSGVIGK